MKYYTCEACRFQFVRHGEVTHCRAYCLMQCELHLNSLQEKDWRNQNEKYI